ncbi:hypothetical protein JAAARDRAFT_197926 [Jaapia argillacea MUCL 33604]|uniref:Uncharacterized protein n=1 Tax=Jaapia argillacea MUCL 33604 TaxID=933084 RepID=A0A067PDJ6_9AGAM|nr:hypothetical protein JAAARDRAFT_197926 [Jaapia argillacea MUCL 33604]
MPLFLDRFDVDQAFKLEDDMSRHLNAQFRIKLGHKVVPQTPLPRISPILHQECHRISSILVEAFLRHVDVNWTATDYASIWVSMRMALNPDRNKLWMLNTGQSMVPTF